MTKPIDWDQIDLVIFDLDGTLYDQRAMHMRMAVEIVFAVARSRSTRLLRVIATYRSWRERLADLPDADFLEAPFAAVAAGCGCSIDEVRSIITEWLEQRPLRHLLACRSSGVSELFTALDETGRITAVFSDYPVEAKLAALRVSADLSVSAHDDDVRRLKPDPAGIEKVLRRTGCSKARTLMIGDRDDRDGEAARRAGIRSLIKASRIHDDRTFQSFRDPVFGPVLAARFPGLRTRTQLRHPANVA